MLSVGTALVAAGAVLLHVCLTRLFAVLHAPDSVFLLVGVAAGGAAAGALLAHRLGWLPSRRLALAATGASVAGALTVVTASLALLAAFLNIAFVNGLLAYV
ncbi:MAG: hypothetical protein ACRDJN_29350, partial [Chloroflexota bacterium]